MNRVIYACAFLSVASAAIIPEDKDAQIIRYDNTNDGLGNYKFSYETSNGITREESGHLVNIGQENEHLEVEGSYSYTDVDGNQVIITYTAGENGYQVNVPPGMIATPEVENTLPVNVVASLLGK